MEDHGGNAVDAAIAALLCVGVTNLHSTGLGGGGFMLIYSSSTKTATALDFREISPKQFNFDGYEKRGVRSFGIPGQLKGMEEAKRRFGNPAVSWETLFAGAISAAENGDITAAAKVAIRITCTSETSGLEKPQFVGKSMYNNTRSFLQCASGVPNKLPQPELAATLDMIAKSGSADVFYNSPWTTELVQEFKEIVGEGNTDVTVEDFNEYEVEERRMIESDFKGYKVHGVGAPASGSIMALLLNVMEGLQLQERDATTLSSIIEAFKIVCPENLKNGDPDINTTVNMAVENMLNPTVATAVKDEIEALQASGTISSYTSCFRSQSVSDGVSSGPGGTTHLSVVDKDGNAVTVTSSINNYFGNLIYSTKTGLIFNNELDDFDPDSLSYSANRPAASKRPRSTAVPTIITDPNTQEVKLVLGAAGGKRIVPAVLQVILGVLHFGQDLQTATNSTRVYVTWDPDKNGEFVFEFEKNAYDYDMDLYERLQELRTGENINKITKRFKSVVQSVYISDDKKFPYSDPRKDGGKADGYRRRKRRRYMYY